MSSFSVPLVHAQGMHGGGVVASHPCNGMRCGRGHTATWTSGYSLHKICIHYQKRQNVKLGLAGYLLNSKNVFRVKTKSSLCCSSPSAACTFLCCLKAYKYQRLTQVEFLKSDHSF